MSTQKIIISDVLFEIPAPYESGKPMSGIEAQVLNRHMAKNIRSNVLEEVTTLLEANKEAEARKLVSEYAANYKPSNRGGRTVDPVEREAKQIAKALMDAQLAKAGKKRTPENTDLIHEKERELASSPAVIEEAKKRVDQQRKAATSVKIDLSGV